MIEATEAIKVGSPFEEILSEESTTNPLRTDSEEILRREAPATVQVPGAMEDGRGTEQYTTTADIRFEFKTSANNYLRIKKGNVLGLERDDEC
ncbi:MAG: hypothetical protein HXY34_12250 [Candidatus Thorarchaeota archaeon]|nr:hypothetical protein [Candidatus Thorarchaeota archaeon]